MQKYGYLELEHTADWALKVWAPDLPTLLITAARGMYALSGIQTDPNSIQAKSIQLESTDAEGLLVDFLSELLFLAELEHVAAIEFETSVKDSSLIAEIRTGSIIKIQKEIKAITYHNLKIIRKKDLLETVIIFDV